MILYISGIHTNIGKTHASAAICHAFNMDYFKLIQAGIDKDSDIISHFSPNTHIFNDGYFLRTAASPHIGRRIENANYSAMDIKIPNSNNLVIEIAGGLFSPICDKYCMIDYMQRFKHPSILIATCYLGCINHILLSIDSLKARHITLLCIVMIGEIDIDICEFITHYSGIKIVQLVHFNDETFHAASAMLKSQLLNIETFKHHFKAS